ncbi:MAG: hypothetical protein NTX15_01830 [Candidatus Kapabacteria bacterium]|nr:hypothetical protein [Candidatus Kapabacteria bacterium]
MRVGTAILTIVIISSFVDGCLRSSTTILVRRDGSATITDTLMLTKSSVQIWREMAKSSKTPLEKILREQWGDSSFYAAASTMGPGVKVRSVKFVQGSTGAGYVSVYDVKDVGTLSVNKNSFHDHMSMNDTSKPSRPSYLRFMRVGQVITVNNMPMTPDPSKDSARRRDSAAALDGQEIHGRSRTQPSDRCRIGDCFHKRFLRAEQYDKRYSASIQ